MRARRRALLRRRRHTGRRGRTGRRHRRRPLGVVRDFVVGGVRLLCRSLLGRSLLGRSLLCRSLLSRSLLGRPGPGSGRVTVGRRRRSAGVRRACRVLRRRRVHIGRRWVLDARVRLPGAGLGFRVRALLARRALLNLLSRCGIRRSGTVVRGRVRVRALDFVPGAAAVDRAVGRRIPAGGRITGGNRSDLATSLGLLVSSGHRLRPSTSTSSAPGRTDRQPGRPGVPTVAETPR